MEFLKEACPYLPTREAIAAICTDDISREEYDKYLEHGWRRSGSCIYRYVCKTCTLCIPIRIEAGKAALTKRAKRIIVSNTDIEDSFVNPCYTDEYFNLYFRYMRSRHPDSELYVERSFLTLLESPIGGIIEYRERSGNLIGLSFLDITPNALSSVYFAFDPTVEKRSLGAFSIYREIEIAKAMGKRYYYLGYWVPNSKKMDYKADFHPFELLSEQNFSDWLIKIEACATLSMQPKWIPYLSRREALSGFASLTAID